MPCSSPLKKVWGIHIGEAVWGGYIPIYAQFNIHTSKLRPQQNVWLLNSLVVWPSKSDSGIVSYVSTGGVGRLRYHITGLLWGMHEATHGTFQLSCQPHTKCLIMNFVISNNPAPAKQLQCFSSHAVSPSAVWVISSKLLSKNMKWKALEMNNSYILSWVPFWGARCFLFCPAQDTNNSFVQCLHIVYASCKVVTL